MLFPRGGYTYQFLTLTNNGKRLKLTTSITKVLNSYKKLLTEFEHTINIRLLSPIAQSVEQVAVNHWVASSSLVRGAKFQKPG